MRSSAYAFDCLRVDPPRRLRHGGFCPVAAVCFSCPIRLLSAELVPCTILLHRVSVRQYTPFEYLSSDSVSGDCGGCLCVLLRRSP